MGVGDPAAVRGTVTYCASEFGGADSEGSAIEQFNTEHGTQGLRARFRKLPFRAGPQHRRRFGRHAERCDVMLVDSAWVGEAAATGVALDLTPYIQARRREFIGPTLDAVAYDDPSLTTPGIEVVKRSLEQAKPRPVTPAWARVSKAIYENVHAALTGDVTARQALQAADRDIDRALAGTATRR